MPADFMGAGFCGMMAARGGGVAVAQQVIKLDMYGSALSDLYLPRLQRIFVTGWIRGPPGCCWGRSAGSSLPMHPSGNTSIWAVSACLVSPLVIIILC